MQASATAPREEPHRLFRVLDAPKPAISPADFQRLMFKRAKALALARAIQAAEQRAAAGNAAEQPFPSEHSAGAARAGGQTSDADAAQPMVVDSKANGDTNAPDATAASAEELAAGEAAAAAARAEEEARAAALRRQLIQSRKEALSEQRQEQWCAHPPPCLKSALQLVLIRLFVCLLKGMTV